MIYTADEKTIRKFNRCKDKMTSKNARINSSGKARNQAPMNRMKRNGRSPFNDSNEDSRK
jgi:hypothetical protein